MQLLFDVIELSAVAKSSNACIIFKVIKGIGNPDTVH